MNDDISHWDMFQNGDCFPHPDSDEEPDWLYADDDEDQYAVHCPYCCSPNVDWFNYDLDSGESEHWKCCDCGMHFGD